MTFLRQEIAEERLQPGSVCLQCSCFLGPPCLEAQVMGQVKKNIVRAVKNASMLNDENLLVISKSNSLCCYLSIAGGKTIHVHYFPKGLEVTACT